jgi:PPOX class probable FMN-dependent enzyme
MTGSDLPPWRALLDAAIGAHPGRPEARYAQLATLRADGRPANRTVVVRGLLKPGSRPFVTTDGRSAKVGHLAASPWAELCWYFPDTREQFRMLGVVTLVGPDGPGADGRLRAWDGLAEPARRSFAWPDPGAPRAGPAAFDPDPPDEPPAWFTLLVLDPEQVDYLDLRTQPHSRVLFVRDGPVWSVVPINP